MIRLLAVVSLPVTLTAQQPLCPRPDSDTTALTLTQVEQRPGADAGNAPPHYPALLRQAAVAGAVRVLFTLDTAGVPEPASVRIERSPNPGFDVAVKRAVTRWRFTPASHCGRHARVRLAHEFLFRPLPRDTARLEQLFEVDTAVTLSADTLPDGTPRTTIGLGLGLADAPLQPWDSLTGDSAEEAVLAQVLLDVRASPDSLPAIACLAGHGTDADPDIGRLVRLTRPGLTVLPWRRCPPTFASMQFVAGRRPPPPGDDPHLIKVTKRAVFSPARMVFEIDAAHATGGYHYQCGAERRLTGWWTKCMIVSSWFH